MREPGYIATVQQDDDYKLHACNAYPELVAALRKSQQHLEARQRYAKAMLLPNDTEQDIIQQHNHALLTKLGD